MFSSTGSGLVQNRKYDDVITDLEQQSAQTRVSEQQQQHAMQRRTTNATGSRTSDNASAGASAVSATTRKMMVTMKDHVRLFSPGGSMRLRERKTGSEGRKR